MKHVIAAIDLGSSSVRAAASCIGRSGQIKLLGLEKVPSDGISEGRIIDLDQACKDISDAIKLLEKAIDRKIKFVTFALSDSGFTGFVASGMIPLSIRPRQICQRDIERCKKIAGLVEVPITREIVQGEVHSYYINDREMVSNPLGLYARKLSVNLYIVTAEISRLNTLRSAVEQAGYILEDITFSGIAVRHAIFSDYQEEGGIAILDIGSHVTNISVFNEGMLRSIKSINKGAQKMIDSASMSTFFRSLKKEVPVEYISRAVITGGGALKEDAIETAEECLGVKCEIGRIRLHRCSLNGSDALLHTASLGACIWKAKKIMQASKRMHPIEGAVRYFTELIDSYF